MVAPFQPEYDHPTFLKAVGELIKANPNIVVVLAGHGVQKGNAPLMALVGGGTLGTRVQLLGEWSDLASLFNACDVVCSSALNDGARMTLVAAMLCGVPCVATGMGAQGEVIGHYGVAIEAGSTPAFVKGIQRVLALTPEKRAAMAQGARKHALQNYVYVRSLQRYLQLYYDLIGRQSLVSQEMPTPEIDASVPVPAKVGATAQSKKPMVAMAELHDPDSLEAKVVEHDAAALPKWRLEQEQQRAKREEDLTQKIASASQQSNGDVLQVFEAELAKPQNKDKAFNERARGVADESEELLSMEAIATPTARCCSSPGAGAERCARTRTGSAAEHQGRTCTRTRAAAERRAHTTCTGACLGDAAARRALVARDVGRTSPAGVARQRCARARRARRRSTTPGSCSFCPIRRRTPSRRWSVSPVSRSASARHSPIRVAAPLHRAPTLRSHSSRRR